MSVSARRKKAVVISLARAHDQGHTAVVFCLAKRGMRDPFQLRNRKNQYIWSNQEYCSWVNYLLPKVVSTLSLLAKHGEGGGKSCFTVCAEARIIFILVPLPRFIRLSKSPFQ